jgi:hypothetical protein
VCKQRSEDCISDVYNGVEQLQLTGDLVESKGTGVAGDLVDSKEHWDRPVTWLIPRSTRMN